jgi:hypothetical protein
MRIRRSWAARAGSTRGTDREPAVHLKMDWDRFMLGKKRVTTQRSVRVGGSADVRSQ